MYTIAGFVALAGGITVGGTAIAANGMPGSSAVGLLAGIVAMLLGYRARRVRRATRPETG